MTNEEKQQLIQHCKMNILQAKGILPTLEGIDPDLAVVRKVRKELQLQEIALAALTAQPVKLPHKWVYIRFTDRSKSQRMKCQIAWSDSLNSVIYDEEGAPLLISNSAYEVQE